LLPLHGIFVFLARGARGCTDGMKGEVWMLGEKEDEALAY
jgi:hypothetical protein